MLQPQNSIVSLLLIFALIGLLLVRELVLAEETPHAARWLRMLNVGIAPLLIFFVFVVTVRTAMIV